MSGHEKGPATPRLPDVVAKLYDVLEPLEPSMRAKAIRTVGTMFDDEQTLSVSREKDTGHLPMPGAASESSPSGLRFAAGKRAQAWLRKNGLTEEFLERVFHVVDGKPQLIATIPGTKKREQTVNAYLLVAVQSFLATDELRFSDGDAVALCKRVGCYDKANHAVTRGTFGNRFSGSKETGYVLTTPGLEQAANLIKAMAIE
jgi:hypothetical protein